MSRSGYTNDCENLGLWRGAVKRAINGERGQDFLRELADAMDAMPEKKLIAEALEDQGCYCAIGVVGAARGMDMSDIDYEDPETVGKAFGISRAMASEIEYMNDEWGDHSQTEEDRWARMRAWVDENIASPDTGMADNGEVRP